MSTAHYDSNGNVAVIRLDNHERSGIARLGNTCCMNTAQKPEHELTQSCRSSLRGE